MNSFRRYRKPDLESLRFSVDSSIFCVSRFSVKEMFNSLSQQVGYLITRDLWHCIYFSTNFLPSC